MISGFAHSVHRRQSAADYDHNHDKDGQYRAVHRNLPAAGPKTTVGRMRVSRLYPRTGIRTGIRSFRKTTRYEHGGQANAQTMSAAITSAPHLRTLSVWCCAE
jgi:hypothetical protein